MAVLYDLGGMGITEEATPGLVPLLEGESLDSC